jgi:hypothetical protein
VRMGYVGYEFDGGGGLGSFGFFWVVDCRGHEGKGALDR